MFADRYHESKLMTPTEVRNALRHGLRCVLPDPCSSGPAFDRWRDRLVHELPMAPVCAARSWLLRTGWLRRGLIGLREVPAAAG